MDSWISGAKPRSTNVAHAADDAFQGGPVMCAAFVFHVLKLDEETWCCDTIYSSLKAVAKSPQKMFKFCVRHGVAHPFLSQLPCTFDHGC